MSFFTHISSFSIGIAVIVALFKNRAVLKSFRPFIYLVSAGFLNEMLSLYLILNHHQNAVNGNIYVLLEFLLILWLFKNWEVQKKAPLIYLAVITVIIWIFDTLILNSINHFSSIYRIFYSFVVIYLSINQMNWIIVNERKNIIKDSKFILCTAFIIFFAYKALLETFFLIELKLSNHFYHSLFIILTFLNLVINLVYALAALWMPTKQRFTLPY